MQLFYFFLLLKHMILELKIEVIFQCDKQFSKQQDPSELSQRSQPTIFFLGVLVSIFLEPITQTMRQDTKPGEDFTCRHCFVLFNSFQKGTWRLQKKGIEV